MSPKIIVSQSLAQVLLPKSEIQALSYRPLQIRIYQSGITRIELKPFDEKPKNPDGQVGSGSEESKGTEDADDFRHEFFIRLRGQQVVPVRTLAGNGFRITNDVFDHEIAYSQISGIYFNENGQRSVSVLLNNGDSVSGNHHWPVIIKVDTKWGMEELSLDEISSVTKKSSSRIIESGVNSPRLILDKK